MKRKPKRAIEKLTDAQIVNWCAVYLTKVETPKGGDRKNRKMCDVYAGDGEKEFYARGIGKTMPAAFREAVAEIVEKWGNT